MLLGPQTRIGLSQADVRDYQARYEARQSIGSRPAGLRLSSTPSHITYASITRAHNNVGRARADSCSSQATICDDNDRSQHLRSRLPHSSTIRPTMGSSIDTPLFDPSAPIFVPGVCFDSMGSSRESHVDRYPPFARPELPQRTSSRRLLESGEHGPCPHGDGRTRSSHRSSPNLLVLPSASSAPQGPRICTRSSSLSWQGTRTHGRRASKVATEARIPDSASSITVQTDRLSRDSPLDELSHQLSRMAATASRPRSGETSLERASDRLRVSLLSGNPFQVDGEAGTVSAMNGIGGHQTALSLRSAPAPKSEDRRDSLMDPHHLYELSVALPSPQIQPSPVARDLRSPVLSMLSPSGPNKTPRAAPHVTVYDDSLSATLQPQTPGDLVRSRAPSHRHSPSVVRRLDEELVGPSVRSVPRRARDRQTYPSHTPARHTSYNGDAMNAVAGTLVRQNLPAEPVSSLPPWDRSSPRQQSSAPVPPQESLLLRQQYAETLPHINVRRSHRSNRSGNSENSLGLSLDPVEEDRRMRLTREGNGDLDATPPAEGRYERYFP